MSHLSPAQFGEGAMETGMSLLALERLISGEGGEAGVGGCSGARFWCRVHGETFLFQFPVLICRYYFI